MTQAKKEREARNIQVLLMALQQEGFVLGTQEKLAIMQWLFAQEYPMPLQRMKFQLAAIVCTNEEEQARFYRIYDNWHAQTHAKEPLPDKSKEKGKQKADAAGQHPEKEANSGKELQETPEQTEASTQKTVISLRKGPKTPPNFRFTLPPQPIRWGQATRRMMQQMRIKHEIHTRQLDMPATIRQAIRHPLHAEFVWNNQTKHGAYVVLVEYSARRSHNAMRLRELTRSMKQHQVDVFVYYYMADPRNLYTHQLHYATNLGQLAARHQGATLLVFGHGGAFVHSAARQPMPWARVLRQWPRRIFFSSVAPSQWGTREQVLSQVFTHVLPGGEQGFRQMAQLLKNGYQTSRIPLRHWLLAAPLEGFPIEPPAQYTQQVFQQWLDNTGLSPDVKNWLFACAVYPELQWPLTLALGKYLDEALLCDDKIKELLRLEWFRNGIIPWQARALLVQNLSEAEKLRINGYIARFMRKSLQGQTANTTAQMQIALHELMAAPTAEERKAIFNHFDKSDWANAIDLVSMHQLNQDAISPFTFEIPEDIQKELEQIFPLQKAATKQIYICHYSDQIFAEANELRNFLSHYNIRGFLQEYDIDVINVKDHIKNTIKKSVGVVVMIGANFNGSSLSHMQILEEVKFAYEKNIPVIPAVFNTDISFLASLDIKEYNDILEKLLISNYIKIDSNNKEEDFSRLKNWIEELPTPNTEHQTQNPKQQTVAGHTMLHIPGGTFDMGSEEYAREQPIHQVTVSGFYMGQYQVTQQQYEEIMGSNPSYFNDKPKSPQHPVEKVRWYDAVEYCNCLSVKAGKTPCYSYEGKGTNPDDWPKGWKDDTHNNITCDFSANGFRLPTEAEWEYAAGGGDTASVETRQGASQPKGRTKYAGTNKENKLEDYAWYKDNSNSQTHPVGEKKPNALDFYDMSGNVWEWCWDWFNDDYYKNSPRDNPKGPESGLGRVRRGGSWYIIAARCRVAYRSRRYPGYRIINLGFRLVLRP